MTLNRLLYLFSGKCGGKKFKREIGEKTPGKYVFVYSGFQ